MYYRPMEHCRWLSDQLSGTGCIIMLLEYGALFMCRFPTDFDMCFNKEKKYDTYNTPLQGLTSITKCPI